MSFLLRKPSHVQLVSKLLKLTSPGVPFISCTLARRLSNNVSEKPDWNDYNVFQKRRNEVLKSLLTSSTRYQRINEREDRSDWGLDNVRAQYMGKYFITHRGCSILKTTEDMVITEQLLWYLRPATIIEIGTYTGGSAIWMADMLRMMEINSHIYSMDIDPTLLEDRVKELQPSNVVFLQGDSNTIEKTFTSEFLQSQPHPWLVFEDAHVNTYNVLKYFHDYLKEGDYLVVEDTNPDLPFGFGYGRLNPTVPYKRAGSKDLKELKAFLNDYKEFYAVDSFYTDLFGYNGTWNWHGYICRMK